MKKHIRGLAAPLALASAALSASPAYALDNIIHEYMSVRTEGMGGVRFTTGQYEENFFSNPARATANPTSKFEVLGLTSETGNPSNVSSLVKAITGGGDPIQNLSSTAGSNAHLRSQLDLFNYFLTSTEERKWSMGIGLFNSTQVDMGLRQDFQANLQPVVDTGLNINYARRFMDNRLSVGTTLHGIARGSAEPNLSFADFLQGKSFSPQGSVGVGLLVDFDLGATYNLPILEDSPFKFSAGVGIDNVLGGNYSLLNTIVTSCNSSSGSGCSPISSPRSLGVGVSVFRQSWGPFENSMLALEFSDIGADSNANLAPFLAGTPTGAGSVWRTIHLGGETRWKVLLPRLGINQGYLSAGLGIDLRYFLLDLATYGEEMSLNSGGFEDRRWAIKITLQI